MHLGIPKKGKQSLEYGSFHQVGTQCVKLIISLKTLSHLIQLFHVSSVFGCAIIWESLNRVSYILTKIRLKMSHSDVTLTPCQCFVNISFFVIFQHFNTKIRRSHYMYFFKDAISNTTALFLWWSVSKYSRDSKNRVLT